jgi:hypothetical protein
VDQVAGRAVPTTAPAGEPPGGGAAGADSTGTTPGDPAEAPAALAAPTSAPTAAPTAIATAAPTAEPTSVPTVVPTAEPTAAPLAAAPEPPAPAPQPPAASVSAPAPTVAHGRVALDDDAFSGGFSGPRNYRGRTAQWIYGALSPHGQMTASFMVQGEPGAGELRIKGLDSENGPPTPIAIVVNGTTIYNGGAPLPKDTWRGAVANWGEATIPIPAGVLRAGRNTLTFKNLVPANNYNQPPYFVLDEVVISY